jgi:hypothetical protein
MATVLELTREPDRFRARVEALPRGTWVVVDEIPKLPAMARIKEVRHPRFFLFDPGVARALLGRSREPLVYLDSWRPPSGARCSRRSC